MAKNYSFYEVLNSNNESDPNMFNLRQRCLIPGLYYDHLSRWLKEFNRNQLFLVFSEAFKRDPFSVLDDIERFLGFQNFLDFSKLEIVSDQLISHLKQLKTYSQIDHISFNFLKRFYQEQERNLERLLNDLK